jgi:GNAT superfamily N-acetyltransferase
MRAVSQELVDFANHHRQPAAPGFLITRTPRYQVTLQPDLPIPGPNSVSYIRCRAEDAEQLIDEVRAIVRPHRLPVSWILDPGTEPGNFAEFLLAAGMSPDAGGPEVAVMVLSIEAQIAAPDVPGLEIHDALADAATFNAADAVNREAFKSSVQPDLAANERRRKNQLAAGNRRLLLATVDGEPAGSAGISLFPPVGAIINGGAVRPKFRGRGVYRAMVAARLAMGREAGVAGLAVWGGHMSRPILGRLGFETVGWRKFYVDLSAV